MESEKKSTHRVDVVRLQLEKHPNADTLSVAKVYDYTCVTQTLQFENETLAAYIPPDSLVPVSRSEFSFLAKEAKVDGYARIKAKKIRGVLSFGLLVPAPEGSEEGDDVAELLGVKHYDPVVAGENNRGGLFMSGEVCRGPSVYCPKYDVDAGRRYAANVFVPSELVSISSKIHGANGRYVFSEGKMYCGSKIEWKKEYPNYSHVTVDSLRQKVGEARAKEIVDRLHTEPKKKNLWWEALDRTPSLRAFCEANPDVIVFGEVYGSVQDLNYGLKKGECAFVAFDLMKDGKWLDIEEAYAMAKQFNVPWVPLMNAKRERVYEVTPVPFNFDLICQLAEGKSLMDGANHVEEGVCVRPLKERYDYKIGRVHLKWVGAGYLEKSR
jgi:RNA ligase (TIGR02306 family)